MRDVGSRGSRPFGRTRRPIKPEPAHTQHEQKLKPRQQGIQVRLMVRGGESNETTHMNGKHDVLKRDRRSMAAIPPRVLGPHERREPERDVEDCQAQVSKGIHGCEVGGEAVRPTCHAEGGRRVRSASPEECKSGLSGGDERLCLVVQQDLRVEGGRPGGEVPMYRITHTRGGEGGACG